LSNVTCCVWLYVACGAGCSAIMYAYLTSGLLLVKTGEGSTPRPKWPLGRGYVYYPSQILSKFQGKIFASTSPQRFTIYKATASQNDFKAYGQKGL